MHQMALFEEAQRIVNVASVPQRSPFRYPGGKTWLVPRVREWLLAQSTRPSDFIEPFAGGGIVSLTVAFEHLAEHVTMIELDDQVSAVWRAIFGDERVWLAEQIVSFDFTSENVRDVLSQTPATLREKAFQTLLKNRVNRGGILAPGAGVSKHGENGKGLASRWYPETLRRRILDIGTIDNRVTFVEGNGLEALRQHACQVNAVFFIDPPYTAAGKKAGSRLYRHSELDHDELFRVAGTLKGDFLMTYDDTSEVRHLAERHGFSTEVVAMKNTHHAKMTELLIGRSLNWLRPYLWVRERRAVYAT